MINIYHTDQTSVIQLGLELERLEKELGKLISCVPVMVYDYYTNKSSITGYCATLRKEED